MDVANGDGEDDDGDPAMPEWPGVKKHLSCSCSSDLFTDSLNSSSFVILQDCPAFSKLFGHHLNKVEDILQNHQEVGQHGDCNGVIGGVSLLLDNLWVSFTDRQPFFRVSSQPHGHLGRQVADHEGELDRVRQFLSRGQSAAWCLGGGTRRWMGFAGWGQGVTRCRCESRVNL